MIFRRGKWDLPKGKLDEGETIENCAKREVEEETGLHNLEIIRAIKNHLSYLCSIWQTYSKRNPLVFDESHI